MSNPEDFAALLAEQEAISSVKLSVGMRVSATVVHAGKESVFVALSPSQEGSVPRIELQDDTGQLTVDVGSRLNLFVVGLKGGIELSTKLAKDQMDVELLEGAMRSGMPVEGTVTGVNKGGLEVRLGSTRGFCPMGQADIGFVEDANTLMGKTLSFLIREIKENGRNVVLSRRALLERERQVKAKELQATLQEGQELAGTVSRITDFGVFVDLGGLDGLIPMSELSYERTNDARSVVQEGQPVNVRVLRIEEDPKRQGQLRIGLSLKATQPEPFAAYGDQLQEGVTVEGRVVKLEKFGAFVQLFPGVQGLVHISEMADRRIRHPSDVVQVGQEVQVRILAVDAVEKRVSLSMKAARDSEQPSGNLTVGALVNGTVERIERYGVFLKLDNGDKALLPAAESGVPKGGDLARAFAQDSVHPVVVIAIDGEGRIKVSKEARERAEERSLVDSYNKSQPSSGSFGTLGDLLKRR